LVYRYEAIERLPRILGEFLDWEVPGVITRNVGSAKGYRSAYEGVRKQMRMPIDFVTNQCNSKMMRHFYSESERRKLIERWAEELQAKNAAIAA